MNLGQSYGRLTVIDTKDARGKCLCRCLCGNEKRIAANSLIYGATLSCGCLRNERVRAALKTHGVTGSQELNSYYGMRNRCLNPNDAEYRNYGGRGIRICDRWLNGDETRSGSECFLIDMGPRPTPKHSIDRRNNDGPYAPENCYWATAQEQIRNRRITAKDKDTPVTAISVETGIKYHTLMDRYRRGDRGERLRRPLRLNSHWHGSVVRR